MDDFRWLRALVAGNVVQHARPAIRTDERIAGDRPEHARDARAVDPAAGRREPALAVRIDEGEILEQLHASIGFVVADGAFDEPQRANVTLEIRLCHDESPWIRGVDLIRST